MIEFPVATFFLVLTGLAMILAGFSKSKPDKDAEQTEMKISIQKVGDVCQFCSDCGVLMQSPAFVSVDLTTNPIRWTLLCVDCAIRRKKYADPVD